MPEWISRTIQVKDMPEGYFRERLLEYAETPEATVIVVAKHGAIGDWAAYCGWPSDVRPEIQADPDFRYYLAHLRNVEGVLTEGDKLSRDEASALFTDASEWPPKTYRP